MNKKFVYVYLVGSPIDINRITSGEYYQRAELGARFIAILKEALTSDYKIAVAGRHISPIDGTPGLLIEIAVHNKQKDPYYQYVDWDSVAEKLKQAGNELNWNEDHRAFLQKLFANAQVTW